MNALIAPRIARKARIVTPIGRSFALIFITPTNN
jgi:hypothetical protein